MTRGAMKAAERIVPNTKKDSGYRRADVEHVAAIIDAETHAEETRAFLNKVIEGYPDSWELVVLSDIQEDARALLEKLS